MLASKRTDFFALGATRQMNSMKPKGAGTPWEAAHGPRGDAYARRWSWGLGFARAGEDLGIITLTGVDTKVVSRSSQIQEKIYHLEHSSLVQIHRWLNRSPQLILDGSNLDSKLRRKSDGNN